MKRKRKSKKAQAALERDIEFYVRLEFDDDVMIEENLLRNAIERSIVTLFGELGRQSIEFELVSFRYGTATIRSKAKMFNRIRCAFALYGIHEKRPCAFRIETKDEENEESPSFFSMWKRYRFDRDRVHFSFRRDSTTENQFDLLLRSEWDRALTQNLFRFQIDQQIQRRILDDAHPKYTIELNPSRFEKRRAPHAFERVKTPFDREKFNFNQIRDEEVLFSLDDEDRHLVIINNSPIRPYHVLLVPDRQLEQPQILTLNALKFAFEFLISSADSFVYVGFNSLCGYASINHLHLHGLYLPNEVFLQTTKCTPFEMNSNCFLFNLFLTEAFAFEIQNVDQFEQIAKNVCAISDYLTSVDVAHNLSIMKGESLSSSSNSVVRVFLWFRQSKIGPKLFSRCNFACLELSGYMFLQHSDVFNDLTVCEIQEEINRIALPIEQRDRIKSDVKDILRR